LVTTIICHLIFFFYWRCLNFYDCCLINNHTLYACCKVFEEIEVCTQFCKMCLLEVSNMSVFKIKQKFPRSIIKNGFKNLLHLHARSRAEKQPHKFVLHSTHTEIHTPLSGCVLSVCMCTRLFLRTYRKLYVLHILVCVRANTYLFGRRLLIFSPFIMRARRRRDLSIAKC
jgi:hypothetical protein